MDRSPQPFEFVELADCMGVAPLLARWHAEEWGELYSDWDEPAALAEFLAMTEPGRIPTTWVAFEPGRRGTVDVLGSISLIADDDLPGFAELGPWLASLYVRPDARGRGLGRQLVANVVDAARRLGCDRLYLFSAGQEAWYRDLGWRTVGPADANGHPATVMRYELHHLAPRRATVSRWLSDPWVGGAYSYLRVGGSPADRRRLATPIAPGLHLAGEATSFDHPGTAHGAWFSGERAADAVLAEGHCDLVVIGAGLAGLVTARKATGAGCRVTVFEAAAEPGGRIRVDRSLGAPLPLGATWAHGTVGNPFHDLAVERGARPRRNVFDHRVTYVAGVGRLGPDAEARATALLAEVEQALDRAAADGPDRPVGEAITAALTGSPGGPEHDAVRVWLRGEFENLYAAPLADLSIRNRAEPFRTEGDDVMLAGDLGSVTDALADGLDLRLGDPVVEVRRTDRGWRVRTASGVVALAEAVVLTCPLPVLQRARITIEPPFPADVVTAISHIGVGPVAKVFLTFDEAWWAPATAFWCAAGEPLPFELWVDVSAFGAGPTLCAFAVGDHARAVERMDADELCEVAWTVLRSTVQIPS